jgi:ferredoxin
LSRNKLMKRIMLIAGGTLAGLLMLSGCHEERACGPCHARVQQAPCCGATVQEGTVIRQEAPPVEHRTEVGHESTTTRPAR